MNSFRKFGQGVIAMTLSGLFFLLATSASAQASASPAAFEPVYILREYMKVEPGMDADYAKVEQLWKTVHQRRKADGKILDWSLYRCLFPGGTNAPYDYMTVTVFKSGKELEETNNTTWDYITKGMSKEDLAIADNTGKTRQMVSTELYQLLERVQPGGKYTKLTQIKVAAGKGGELEKLEKMMNPVFEEAVKMGKIAAWRFGRRLYPLSGDGGNYYRVISANNLNDMLNSESNGFIEAAFKKVYPDKDFQATNKAIRDLVTVVSVQLWERVDMTN